MSTEKSEVAAWIAENAAPLKGVKPGLGFEDLAPLKEWIGDARVVGMGEATHGTSEFFQFKHRMLEFLVSELGFTLFLIEAPVREPLAVNQYILTGDGDTHHSLASMPWWCWNCEEVAALIEWMRHWNATHDRKIFFYGCDIGTTAPAAMFLLDYLKRHDLQAYNRLRESLLPLATEPHIQDWGKRSEEDRERIRVMVEDIVTTLQRLKVESGSDRHELGLALLQASALRQYEQFTDPSRSASLQMGIRDRAIAENAAALLELHGPGSKAMVWAANTHVQLRSTGYLGFTAPPAGENLRAIFGEQYVVLGFSFEHGCFSAIDSNYNARAMAVEPRELDSVLAAAGPPLFAVDLRAVSDGVAQWFAEAWPTNAIGSWPAGVPLEDRLRGRRNVRELFDILVFVRESSASHVRESISYLADCHREYPPAPEGLANLDFSAGMANWRMLPQPTAGAYHTAVIPQGKRNLLEISRSESMWPWDIYTLSQTASAAPWRGRRIVVRCAASIEAAHDGSSAQLAVRVLREHGALNGSGPKGPMWHRAVTWMPGVRDLAVMANIEDSADRIDIALLMTGDGRALFGPVEIEDAG